MPTFDWDVGPVLLRIPREILLYSVTAFGVLSVLWALIKRNRELLSMGFVISAAAGIGWLWLKSDFEIRYYSLLFVFVFLGGHALLNWQVKRAGGDEEEAGDFIVYGVLGVLVGSRLGHVLFYDLDHALRDPLWVFKIWEGGLASHGAVVGLITAMYLFTKRRGVAFLEGADRFAFSAALGATLVRLGNFFNSEIVGRVTDQTWGVRFLAFPEPNGGPHQLRHPSQLYEVCLGLTVMLVLYLVDRAAGKERRPRGLLISTFFAVYFTGRFCVEFVKEFQIANEEQWSLTMGQFLSLPGILLGYYGIYWSLKNRVPAVWREYAEDEELDDADGEGDDEDADDGDEPDDAAAPARKAQGKTEDDEDAEPDDPHEDPDVAAEFDAQGLKKRRAADED